MVDAVIEDVNEIKWRCKGDDAITHRERKNESRKGQPQEKTPWTWILAMIMVISCDKLATSVDRETFSHTKAKITQSNRDLRMREGHECALIVPDADAAKF